MTNNSSRMKALSTNRSATVAASSNFTGAISDCWTTEELINLNLVMGIIVAILSVLGTFSNLFIIVVVLVKKLWKQNQFLLILSLAVVDLLVSVVLMPIEVSYHLTYENERYFLSPIWTVFQNAFWYTMLSLSIYNLLLLSLERLVMIRYPFYHLKTTYIAYGIAFVWTYAVAMFSYYFFFQKLPESQEYDMRMPHSAESIGLFLGFVLPVCLNTIIYFYVFQVVRVQRMRIASLSIGTERTITSSGTSKLGNNKLYLYVCFVFMVLWIPWSLIQIVFFIRPDFYYDCIGGSIDAAFSSLMFINNFGNAIIYGSSNHTFRNVFRKILCRQL